MAKRTVKQQTGKLGHITHEFSGHQLMYRSLWIAGVLTVAAVARRAYGNWQDNRFESLPGSQKSPLETVIAMLHTDPETIPGVPTNEEIIEAHQDQKKLGMTSLSAGERQGFLEMWRFGQVRDYIVDLDTASLTSIVQDSSVELESIDPTDSRVRDLRFVYGAARETEALRID
ncbi:MAG TPA: hypothetical protein VG992_03475 [Candidatus Saccharimonadales bacterium]|nr:hypothetical protein [Candidatus Saccharimonadales bacterium]